MNPTDPSDPLLDALLADPGALDAMHATGLAALRRRRRWRRVCLSAGSSAAAACLLLALRAPRDDGGKNLPAAAPLVAKAGNVALPSPPSDVQELDDDELLHQFPPGTCTIAEVDGRKMLVFLGDEARAKYQR